MSTRLQDIKEAIKLKLELCGFQSTLANQAIEMLEYVKKLIEFHP